MQRQEGAAAGGVYRIQVRGHLDPSWSAWFDDFRIIQDPGGITTLEGHVGDQSALHGLLIKIRNLGLPLISVIPIHTRDSRR